MGRHLERVDQPLSKPVGRHVPPGRPVVTRHMDQAVVAARVDRPPLVRRLDHVRDRAVDLAARTLVRDRRATVALLLVIVAREVRADLRPRHAPIARADQHVRGMVDRAVVVWRRHDRRVPVVAVLHLATLQRRRHHRVDPDVARSARPVVVLADDPHVAAGVHEARVVGIEGRIGALAPAHGIPILPGDPTASATRDRDRAVVLLATVDVIRESVVHRHAVELGRGLISLGGPGVPAVERHVRAAVVGVDHDLVVVGADPQVVRVTVRHPHVREGSAPVDRLHHRGVEDVDRLLVDRVRVDLDVVPGARAQRPVVGGELPGLPAVVRSEDSAPGIGLDDREDAIGVGARDVDRGLAQELGHPVLDPIPGVPTVRRLPEPTPRAPAPYLPGKPAVLPEGRVEDAGIRHVHR